MWSAALGVTPSVHFRLCNATINFERILEVRFLTSSRSYNHYCLGCNATVDPCHRWRGIKCTSRSKCNINDCCPSYQAANEEYIRITPQKMCNEVVVARCVRSVSRSNVLQFCRSEGQAPPVQTYPGRLDLTLIQCPDPQFKTRHHKRRIVQPALAAAVARRTASGGAVYLSSDVLEVAEDMRDIFEQHACSHLHPDPPPAAPQAPAVRPPATLTTEAESAAEVDRELSESAHPSVPHPVVGSEAARDVGSGSASSPAPDSCRGSTAHLPRASGWGRYEWLPENPTGLVTERELSVLHKKGGDMYRMLLRKAAAP